MLLPPFYMPLTAAIFSDYHHGKGGDEKYHRETGQYYGYEGNRAYGNKSSAAYAKKVKNGINRLHISRYGSYYNEHPCHIPGFGPKHYGKKRSQSSQGKTANYIDNLSGIHNISIPYLGLKNNTQFIAV